MYKGTIIENSLSDKNILSSIDITRTWHSGDWILHDVLLKKEQIPILSDSLADGPWYIHTWEPGKDDVIVIFKGITFTIKHSDKATWAEAIKYGKSIGIPEEQLDFVLN